MVLVSLLAAMCAAKPDPDLGLRMKDIVTSKGYPIEDHFATTPDGFVLHMFRIPRGRQSSSGAQVAQPSKPVVFINHALLDSSWAFVANAPEESLGYILADAGYDVWFGNNRGNSYSRNHTSLSPTTEAFWNFSFDEMALIDLPTHLNFVLEATGAENLSYVGHSQGTIQAFAGFSLEANRAVAERVNLFVAHAGLAPASSRARLKPNQNQSAAPPVSQSLIASLHLRAVPQARARGIRPQPARLLAQPPG